MIEELRHHRGGVRASATVASRPTTRATTSPSARTLPRDKEAVLEALDYILNDRDERRLKPESLRAL